MLLYDILLLFYSLNSAKNMKRKFQFLRRRNTDSAIGAPMVTVHSRPSVEQATTWSQSFDTLLSDKCKFQCLKFEIISNYIFCFNILLWSKML